MPLSCQDGDQAGWHHTIAGIDAAGHGWLSLTGGGDQPGPGPASARDPSPGRTAARISVAAPGPGPQPGGGDGRGSGAHGRAVQRHPVLWQARIR